jgi:hypothetical protein
LAHNAQIALRSTVQSFIGSLTLIKGPHTSHQRTIFYIRQQKKRFPTMRINLRSMSAIDPAKVQFSAGMSMDRFSAWLFKAIVVPLTFIAIGRKKGTICALAIPFKSFHVRHYAPRLASAWRVRHQNRQDAAGDGV